MRDAVERDREINTERVQGENCSETETQLPHSRHTHARREREGDRERRSVCLCGGPPLVVRPHDSRPSGWEAGGGSFSVMCGTR
jgi:hypothetical protein